MSSWRRSDARVLPSESVVQRRSQASRPVFRACCTDDQIVADFEENCRIAAMIAVDQQCIVFVRSDTVWNVCLHVERRVGGSQARDDRLAERGGPVEQNACMPR